MRRNKWIERGRPKEHYDDVSCKDAPGPLELPKYPCLICDCGKLAGVDQSTHEYIAAWVYYTCNDYRVSERVLMLLICCYCLC
jgi:hypothetical protein